ncbi:MAG: hypothetical protein E7515_08945 [Ruminococcaceae bacterium]|nr:hypothetical protein [Oscillospiraceae bacterium]
MFSHFENIDLTFLFDKEGSLSGFVSKVLDSSRIISGYGGFYLYSSIGDPEFEIISDIDEKNKELQLASMETHICGDNVWEMAVATDITDKNAHKMKRSLVFRNAETGEGLVPIGLRFSDVVPSFLPDDIIKMQVVAFAESIDLYKTEEDYFSACEKDENGNVVEPGNGVIFPSGLVHNHTRSAETGDGSNDTAVSDLYVVLRSKIKRISRGGMTNWWKTDDEPEQSFHTFYSVTVDTLYGEIDIIVGVSQLTEEQKPLLKEGSVIYTVCTLSGDVVLDEFENGALYNEECDLRLIRQGLVSGEIDRTFEAFDENASFEFSSENIEASGKAEAFKELKKYCSSKERFITALASASVVFDDGSVDYTSTRRCVAVSYGNEIAEHLIFIDTDEKGKIARLKIVSALGYELRIDKPEYEYDDDLYGEDGFGDMN